MGTELFRPFKFTSINASRLDPQLPCRKIRLICSGPTFRYSVRNATSSSHCFFACASSELSISLSFLSFSFFPVNSAYSGVAPSTDPGFFESGDEVELDPDPMSSPPEFDGEFPPPPDFSAVEALAVCCVTVFRCLISQRSSFCPRWRRRLPPISSSNPKPSPPKQDRFKSEAVQLLPQKNPPESIKQIDIRSQICALFHSTPGKQIQLFFRE